MTPQPDGAINLHEPADEQIERSRIAHTGRVGRTLPHPVEGLRQTVIALRAGAELSEHESPGSATLHVLRGRVRLVAQDDELELSTDQLCPIPDCRHTLHADEDAVVLLSVAQSR